MIFNLDIFKKRKTTVYTKAFVKRVLCSTKMDRTVDICLKISTESDETAKEPFFFFKSKDSQRTKS